MNNNISKQEIKNYLNSYNWISWYAKINTNNNLELSIILGEPMAKKSKLDMILEKLDKLDQDMVQVKQNIVELKSDVALIKQCPTIKKELELITNN